MYAYSVIYKTEMHFVAAYLVLSSLAHDVSHVFAIHLFILKYFFVRIWGLWDCFEVSSEEELSVWRFLSKHYGVSKYL